MSNSYQNPGSSYAMYVVHALWLLLRSKTTLKEKKMSNFFIDPTLASGYYSYID